MKKLELYITKGVKSDATDRITDFLRQSSKDKFVLTVEPVKSIRSRQQNNFLHLLCRGFEYLAKIRALTFKQFDETKALDLGHWSMPAFKGFLAELYLAKTDPKTGIRIVRSTSSLTVDEFRDYLEKIIDDYLFNGGIIEKDKDELYKGAMGL